MKCHNNPNVTEVLMCSVNNCQATIDYLHRINPHHITFVASGDEVTCREDMLFGYYLESLYHETVPKLSMEEIQEDVKETSGNKFFKHLPQFPEVDFYECFKLDSIPIVMRYEQSGEIVLVH